MTFASEFSSWLSRPQNPPTSTAPKVGNTAPVTPNLPLESNKRSVLAFLRHCGCPFSEKTFARARAAAQIHSDIDFIVISHSDQSSTDNWLKSLPDYGTDPSNLKVVVDDQKLAYAAYGLGVSGWMHVINYTSLSQVFSLKKEGIDVRPTESGSRWQTSGTFALGPDGQIKWGGPAQRADDIPDFEEAVKALA